MSEAPKKKRFSIAGSTDNFVSGNGKMTLTDGYFYSEEEAIGHGYVLLNKDYPISDGWGNYFVLVREIV